MNGVRPTRWWQLVLAAAMIPLVLYAYDGDPTGPPTEHTGGFGEPTCTECHLDFPLNSGTGSVTIAVRDLAGNSVASYSPGQTYQITVRVADPNPTQKRWGFQMSARAEDDSQAGNLIPGTDGFTMLDLPTFNGIQYMSHTFVGTRNGTLGGVNFSFRWAAPAVSVGDVVFNAAGNAANGDSDPGRDRIYSTSLTLPGPAACVFVVDPLSVIVSASGGTSSATVTADSGCNWSASSNSGFIAVMSGSNDSGTDQVMFSVAANTDAAARSGTLTIAGKTFMVSQAGTAPPQIFQGGVVNNASFAANPAPMAPGSIAAIFGNNMNDGTSNPNSSFVNGSLAKVLGAASVKINGIDAPIFYSFPTQIGAQIPFELAGQTSASLVLTVAGQSGAPQQIPLSATAPGIFTTNQSGTGQGAILIANSDVIVAPVGSIPGRTTRPANRGDAITIFCTGLGVTSPAGSTGGAAGALETSPRATVLIDGLNANVLYSGTAPTFVGLYQVNATVPSGAHTGNNITVKVILGGQTSNTATIAVQ